MQIIEDGYGGNDDPVNSELVDFVVELSERLADESDYDDYLKPKLEQLIEAIKGQSEEIDTLLKAIKEYERGE
jgi:hypothetical protein